MSHISKAGIFTSAIWLSLAILAVLLDTVLLAQCQPIGRYCEPILSFLTSIPYIVVFNMASFAVLVLTGYLISNLMIFTNPLASTAVMSLLSTLILYVLSALIERLIITSEVGVTLPNSMT